MDGYSSSAVTTLSPSRHGNPSAMIPIPCVVLLTNDTFSIDVVKALSLGAQEYWHKPLTSERLTVGLSRALEAVRRPAS